MHKKCFEYKSNFTVLLEIKQMIYRGFLNSSYLNFLSKILVILGYSQRRFYQIYATIEQIYQI